MSSSTADDPGHRPATADITNVDTPSRDDAASNYALLTTPEHWLTTASNYALLTTPGRWPSTANTTNVDTPS